MKNLFTCLFFLISISSFSQTKDLLAKSEFMAAEKSYQEGDYDKSIDHLDKAKEILENTNPILQYLYVKSYFGKGDWDKAQSALEKYFEIADESDPKYQEMVAIISKIRDQKEQETLSVNIGDEEWEKIQHSKNITDLKEFVLKYPKSQYAEEAKNKIEELNSTKKESLMVLIQKEQEQIDFYQTKIKKRKKRAITSYIVGPLSIGLGLVLGFRESVQEDEDYKYIGEQILLVGGTGLVLFGVFNTGNKKNKRKLKQHILQKEIYEKQANELSFQLQPSSNSFGLAFKIGF